MTGHQARFTEHRGKVHVACSCGVNLGKHNSWPDARQAHDAHLITRGRVELREFFAAR